jgi:hypothetical protein
MLKLKITSITVFNEELNTVSKIEACRRQIHILSSPQLLGAFQAAPPLPCLVQPLWGL